MLLGGISGLAFDRFSAPTLLQGTPSDDDIALVGGQPVPRAEYEVALASIAADKRWPIGLEDRRLALERVIQERLLLNEVYDRDLVRGDMYLRRNIVLSMLTVGSAWESGDVKASTSGKAAQDPTQALLRELRSDALIERRPDQ